MIAYGNSLIAISVPWADLKTKITAIATPYHYGETEDLYEVFIVDVNVVYTTQIQRGTVPLSSDISQEANDLIKADFEADYKTGANVPFSSVGIITTSTAPRNDHEMINEGLMHAHINSLLFMDSPYAIDFQFPTAHALQYLWGMSVHVKDFGDDDYLCMQIIDKDNILGYGVNTVLKEYDNLWAHTAAKSVAPFYTPDGAPGEIAGGLYGRVLYYPSDATKLDVKVWLDYVITIKS